jgi:hypothetical protein
MIKPPWSAIRWGYKAVIDQIINDYRSCPNVVEIENKLYCYTWYRHDDCERIRQLLYKITKNDLYTLPEMRPAVKQALDEMLADPNTAEILRRLEENGI